jgi:hypothetical protein
VFQRPQKCRLALRYLQKCRTGAPGQTVRKKASSPSGLPGRQSKSCMKWQRPRQRGQAERTTNIVNEQSAAGTQQFNRQSSQGQGPNSQAMQAGAVAMMQGSLLLLLMMQGSLLAGWLAGCGEASSQANAAKASARGGCGRRRVRPAGAPARPPTPATSYYQPAATATARTDAGRLLCKKQRRSGHPALPCWYRAGRIGWRAKSKRRLGSAWTPPGLGCHHRGQARLSDKVTQLSGDRSSSLQPSPMS